MPCDDASTSRRVERFEVFTGAGHRRDWGSLKAAIVDESYAGVESVSAVARRHGLSPSQLFTWRRERRKELETQGGPAVALAEEATRFVPAVVGPAPVSPAPSIIRRRRRSAVSAIELEIDGAVIRIAPGADRDLITAVIDALRAPR